jgi:archaetidylinositol phosphate synthase
LLSIFLDISPAMQPVDRIQQNILAAAERRLLTWLCARLPMWVTPDKLTMLGFFGAVLVGTGYALSTWGAAWLALSILGYGVNWFGDSLDGSLARYRAIERPQYGYFIDHSADSLANMILVTGMGLSPYVRLDIALVGLAGYLLMSIHTFLAARVLGEFRLSYLSSGPTELRLILIAITIGMIAVGPGAVTSNGWTLFDYVISLMAAILIGLFIIQTFATGRRLRRS